MPTYDYRCASCGTYEWVHGITEPAMTVCPKCSGTTIERLFTPTKNIVVKTSKNRSSDEGGGGEFGPDAMGDLGGMGGMDGDGMEGDGMGDFAGGMGGEGGFGEGMGDMGGEGGGMGDMGGGEEGEGGGPGDLGGE